MVSCMDLEKEWAARVAAWRASGQSAVKFCEGKSFSVHSLRRWSSELGARRSTAESVTVSKAREKNPRLARAVIRPEAGGDVAGTSPKDAGVTLAIGAVQVRVERGFDPEVLRTVIESLRSTSAGRMR